MKKILLATLLAVALLITLVACSNDKKEETTTAAEQLTTVAGETATTVAEEKATTVAEQATTIAGENATTVAEEATTVAEAVTTVEEATTEEETTDPSVPVLFYGPEEIYDAATNGTKNGMTAELSYKSVMLIPDAENCDPWVQLGTNVKPGSLAVIKYRSSVATNGEFFIGSEGGPHGLDDEVQVTYENTNGEWSYTTAVLTDATAYNGVTAAYLRYDFYGSSAETLQVAWIACFDDSLYALGYLMQDMMTVEIIDRTSENADFKNYSFDTFYLNGEMYFAEDGKADEKLAAQDNTVTFKYGETHDSVMMRGWIGFNQPIDTFGIYAKVDYEDIQISTFIPGDYATATEPGVLDAGGQYASRFEISVDLTEMTIGTWTVGAAARLADGRIVSIYELTVNMEDAGNLSDVGSMSPDVYYEDGQMMQVGSANEWLAANRANGISFVDTVAFYGWAHMGDAVVADFGYAICRDGIDDIHFGFEPEFDSAIIPILNNEQVRRYTIEIPVGTFEEAGEYEIKLLVKDADGNVYKLNSWGDIKYVNYGTRPDAEHYEEFDENVILAGGTQGGPYSGDVPFGYQFYLFDNEYLNTVTVVHMATYSDAATVGTFKLYHWMGDLDSTRASTPIYTEEIVNHQDNQSLVIDVSKYNISGGNYYFECQSTTGKWTPWKAGDGDNWGTGYVGDSEASFLAEINISEYVKMALTNIAPLATVAGTSGETTPENVIDGKLDTVCTFATAQSNIILSFDNLYKVKKVIVHIDENETGALLFATMDGTDWNTANPIYTFEVGETGDIEIYINSEYCGFFLGKTEEGSFVVSEFEVIADVIDEVLPFKAAIGGGQSTDTYLENGEIIVEGSAAKWLGGVKPGAEGDRIDGIKYVDNAGFRGWVGLGDVEIESFGYIISDDYGYEMYFSDEFTVPAESGLAESSGQPNVSRYLVTVDFTTLTDAGEYKVDILVKGKNGVIYKIDKWDSCTSVKFIKTPEAVDVSEASAIVAHAFDSAAGRWLNDSESHTGETPVGGAKAWFTGWIGTTESWDDYKIGMYMKGSDMVIEKDFGYCTANTGDEVINAATNRGAEYATRYVIEESFPMAELSAGTYTIVGYIKVSDGTMVNIGEVEFEKK